MTNLAEPKFAGCRECFFYRRRSNACRSCEAGENFEPTAAELDPAGLRLDPDQDADDDE